MNNHNLLKLFVDEIKNIRALAKNTVYAYTHDVKVLYQMMDKCKKKINQLTYEDIVSFIEALRIDLDASTVNRAIFAWKTFFRSMYRLRKVNKGIWQIIDKLETANQEKKIPEMLTCQELKEFMDGIETESKHGMIVKVIIEMLYGTGVRVSELCNIKVKDMDLDNHTVQVVHGKGGKSRTVIIAPYHVRLLKEYWKRYRNGITNDDYAIVGMRGHKLDRTMVYRFFMASARQHGITKHIYPLTIRHCFATHMLENGAPLPVIQSLMGHSLITTTERYLNLSTKFIQEQFKKFHPHY